MKKVGIVTLFGENYGNKLQNYAVQYLFEKKGFDVETIIVNTKSRGIVMPKNTKTELAKFSPFYMFKVCCSRFKTKYLYKNSRDGITTSVKFVKTTDYKSLLKAKSSSFDDFTNKNIRLSKNELNFENENDNVWKSYDYLVTGSDQVWNPTYQSTSRLYFLSFVPKQNRIAIAPSIGLAKLPEYVKPFYTEWLNGIEALSIREEKGAQIIKELTGRDVPVLADPTLCVSREEWLKLEEKPGYDCSKPYVFTYFLGNETNCYRKYINAYAKRNNCKVINIFDIREEEHYITNPAHFIYLIHNAKMVFTDSFHGSVFSLIMHTPFIIFDRIENGGQGMSSRIDTLLKTFSMENRHFSRICDIDVVDFSNVDNIIANLQKKTDEFLNDAFSKLSNINNKEKNAINFLDFLNDKRDCCGCYACKNACPKDCIKMVVDNEGFWYPSIDYDRCIHCNLCKKVCPAVNESVINNKPISYVGYNNDKDVRKNSSSGGLFTAIAEHIVKDGGVVYGAAFNNRYEVEHICVDNVDDLAKLRGSKYVQSKVGDTYSKAKEMLKNGRTVLFTGTPCQIEGLYSYLGKEKFNNLFTQDIICHGVPSPNVWNEYLKYRANGADIRDVSFRDKKYGWHYFSMKIDTVKKKYTKRLDDDLFIRLFLDNTILRPSCYFCKFKKEIRISDFTLADCWRPKTVKSYLMDDDKGLSMIFVNTEKGKILFEELKDDLVVQEIDYDLAIQSQSAATLSVKPNIHRSDFFVEFNNKDFAYIEKNWYGNDLISHIKKTLIYEKSKLNNMLKR